MGEAARQSWTSWQPSEARRPRTRASQRLQSDEGPLGLVGCALLLIAAVLFLTLIRGPFLWAA